MEKDICPKCKSTKVKISRNIQKDEQTGQKEVVNWELSCPDCGYETED